MIDRIKEQAEQFAVWRMGKLHTWECTYQEAADATGLIVVQVKRICLLKGWRFQDDQSDFEDVDSFMDHPNIVDVIKFHV